MTPPLAAAAAATTDPDPRTPAVPQATALAIGARLRQVRRQQGLTLDDVERLSGGVWKAVAVSAYERGTRGITLARLADLAGFYEVPVVELLSGRRPSAQPPASLAEGASGSICVDCDGGHTLDLAQLRHAADRGDEGLRAVHRFSEVIRRQRGDLQGRVVTLRRRDLAAVAISLGGPPDGLHRALHDVTTATATA